MINDDTDSDSGIDTDMDSDYTSISSTNYQYREESGRRSVSKTSSFILTIRFHGFDAPYLLPNDSEEAERLQDLQAYHKAFFGSNILAPISGKPTLIGKSMDYSGRRDTEG